MSYDIDLCDTHGNIAVVEPHAEGGTFALGGTEYACINITYNYAEHFSFREIDGMIARDTIDMLSDAVIRLGVQRDADYWNPTPGNAGYAASILLKWARQHPDCVWGVN